jgi:hypothetical protein
MRSHDHESFTPGVHRWIGSLGLACSDLSRLRALLTARDRARRGGSPTVDDGG